MDYKTFEPIKDLSGFVQCYWTLESGSPEILQKQTIIPDACMEMIFHYGDLYREYTENGNSIIQPRCFVIGQLTKPLEIEPTGETSIFSVRFQPGGFFPFFTVPIKELEDKAVSLEKLFGKDGKEIGEKILNALSTSERIKLIEAFLLRRLMTAENIDRLVSSLVEMIFTTNGQLSINEVSKQTNINRRQLERKFSKAIGLSPKQLSKTIRLQAALKMLLDQKFTDLTSLSCENEFYDQSHFIKDFKEFTGFSPKEFYGSQFEMSSFFYRTE